MLKRYRQYLLLEKSLSPNTLEAYLDDAEKLLAYLEDCGIGIENVTLDDLKNTWMAKLHDDCMFVSARERQNIDELRELLYQKVRELHVQKYPYNDFLYQNYDEQNV